MYHIRPLTYAPKKEYPLNEWEVQFLDSLSANLSELENSRIWVFRLSDGTLSVDYLNKPVGKVRFQGRKHWMQIIKNLYDVETIEGELFDFIPKIPEWVLYIRKYLS